MLIRPCPSLPTPGCALFPGLRLTAALPEQLH